MPLTCCAREAVERLALPFALLSDAEMQLARGLRLPTFDIELPPDYDGGGNRTLLKRLTLVVRERVIERVFCPVFPPDTHASEVFALIRSCNAE